jgi:4-amino-4-deoxy-L-arabinose transferase-like glycosyltransferase
MHWSVIGPLGILEYLVLGVVVAGALLTPARGRRWLLARGRQICARFAERPVRAFGLLALAWNLLPLAFYRPVPNAHDEFGHLLIADTFLEGRLTNPTHPMWVSFESFHIFHHPTYAAKYPPLAGLLLALGQLVFHSPILGVKLCMVLASIAAFWALRGWLPPLRAAFGGLLFTLWFGGFSYWSQSFMSGAEAALGGALVLGAFPRLLGRPTSRAGVASRSSPRPRDSALLGIGLALLSMSRPFEGLVLSLPLCLLLFWRLLRRRPGAWSALARGLLPAALIGGLALGSIAFYNQRVTADPFEFPYQNYTKQYGYGEPFRFQTPNQTPPLRHAVMQRFLEFEKKAYRATFRERWQMMTRFFVAPLLLPVLLLVPWLLRRRRTRWTAVLGVWCLAALLLETFSFPHHAAPFAALLVLVIVDCLRLLRIRRGAAHRFMLTAWLYFWIAGSGLAAWAQGVVYSNPHRWQQARERIRRELVATGERHLVFVRYSAEHNPQHEWVYNRADIDGAPVVWAREVSPEQDAAVDRYFADRTVWRVEPDGGGEIQPLELRAPRRR